MSKKSVKDLMKILDDQRKSVEKLAGDVYKGKEKNIFKIRNMKKELARIKTLLVQKAKEEQSA